MTLIQDTVRLLNRVSKETNLETANPSSHTLFMLYNELLQAYTSLGEEMCRKFSAKEAAYIRRKINQGKAYFKGRYDKRTQKDAEMDSLIAVEKELMSENESAELYEEYRVVRDSVAHAIDYIRSLNSYLAKSESLPDPR